MMYPLNDLTINPKENPDLCKEYVYLYLDNHSVVYAGRGSNKTHNNFGRARDLSGHAHCIPDGYDPIANNFNVKIVAMDTSSETIRNIEATYIRGFDLVESGWNNREEIETSKFYNIISEITNPDPDKRKNVKNLVHILMDNATGAKGTESLRLAKHILDNILIEDQDICVVGNEMFGGFNLISELVRNEYPYEALSTICSEEMSMKIGADDTMDKSFLNVNTGIENFLKYNFQGKKFNIIIMNPPWTGLGIQFIEKAISLLKKGGKLVCIIGLDQFSPISYKNAHKPGTFWWMNQKGTFERIETSRHDGAYGTKEVFFNNGAACWFVWRNEQIKTLTHINNKLEEEFFYDLTGDEWLIPEEPFEIMEPYVDWSESGIQFSAKNTTLTKKEKETGISVPSSPNDFRFKFNERESFINYTGDPKRIGCTYIPHINQSLIDPQKVESFFMRDVRRNLALHARSITTYTRHYPLKPEIFLKDEFIEKKELDDESE